MQKATFLISFLWILVSTTQAQFDAFQQKAMYYDSVAIRDGRERIFIHNDKPQYVLNDTVWMKGYIMAGGLNIVNDSSHIAYIELVDANGELVKRVSTLCNLGLFYSNITLTDALFGQGVYTLRAYTNRMRNFGDSLFFEQTLTIVDPQAPQWKASVNQVRFVDNRLLVSATLKDERQGPVAHSPVSLVMRSGNKVIYRRRIHTDGQGNIFMDTLLKDPKLRASLRLELSNGTLHLPIPIPPEQGPVDLQFLPEGGWLVAGYRQRVGFKALDIYGRGVAVKGVIKDQHDKVVDSFASVHNGMGYLWLTPQAGQQYTAVLANGRSQPFPQAMATGALLQVVYNDARDSIIARVRLSPEQAGAIFYIAGTTRGVSYLRGRLRGKTVYEVAVAASNFPSGVARFTLYDEQEQPLNEQAFFVWHAHDLKLEIKADKQFYINKDSVHLFLQVKDENDAPVPGSFSIAVIDTSQVVLQPDAENIVSYMLLSAELKGQVEDPYFYIRHPQSAATTALMLTQGWVRYPWVPADRKFKYEKEFAIKGTVTNLLNHPSVGTRVTLFGRQGRYGVFFQDTVTNEQGAFSFNGLPLFITDSVSALIKAVNKRGKSFGLGVDVVPQEFPAPPQPGIGYDPNRIIFDTAVRKAIDQRSFIMEQLRADGRYLEEVVVKAKAKIPDSKNLNEDGGADQTIGAAVLEQTPKASILQVLSRKIPGFPVVRGAPLRIGRTAIYIVMDGMDLAFFEMDPFDILEYYAAEDVKGIEVMSSMGYISSYVSRYLNPMAVDWLNPPIFIEITTYGGVGPFLKKVPGTYLLKPNVPFVGKQFYSPRYSSTDAETVFPDLRQTLYWNADIVTDKNGAAAVSFYTSESSSGGYLMIVQGTDLKGRFGIRVAPLRMEKKP